jgi:hypothetical protein
MDPVPALYWGNLQLSGNSTDTNYFVHTRIEFAIAGISSVQPVMLDSSAIRQIRGNGLTLGAGAAGSRILRSRIDTVVNLASSSPAVSISASNVVFSSAVHGAGKAGILLAPGLSLISFDHCEVTGSAAGGIAANSSMTIHNCNFSDNGENAVITGGTAAVDATDNWWGDADGPLGSSGDGVSGAVNFTPFLTAPVTLPIPPAP